MTDTETLPIDPVCGMEVDPDTGLRAAHQGSTFYFCHPSCLEKFTADPEAVLHPPPAPPADREAIYTCPMHPEVAQQVGPGSCPICGMALEPAMVTLDDGPNVELIDMTRRFWIAAALGVPVMVFAMAEMVAPMRSCTRALTVASPIGCSSRSPRRSCSGRGWPFFARAWDSIVNRSPNMFTLIGIGVGAATATASWRPWLRACFLTGFRTHGRVEPYFDTAVVITALVLLGQVLENPRAQPDVRALEGPARPGADDRAAGDSA